MKRRWRLSGRGIRYERQKPVAVSYKGNEIGQSRLNFVVESSLVLELKSVQNLAPVHKAQMISYLKATGLQLGLLINFNVRMATEGIQRVILTGK